MASRSPPVPASAHAPPPPPSGVESTGRGGVPRGTVPRGVVPGGRVPRFGWPTPRPGVTRTLAARSKRSQWFSLPEVGRVPLYPFPPLKKSHSSRATKQAAPGTCFTASTPTVRHLSAFVLLMTTVRRPCGVRGASGHAFLAWEAAGRRWSRRLVSSWPLRPLLLSWLGPVLAGSSDFTLLEDHDLHETTLKSASP